MFGYAVIWVDRDDSSTTPQPLILFLHGAHARGSDIMQGLQSIKYIVSNTSSYDAISSKAINARSQSCCNGSWSDCVPSMSSAAGVETRHDMFGHNVVRR